MKKNALLGVFALLFAVGTAFATAKPQTQPVYYYQVESTQEDCVQWDIDYPCDPAPGICRAETPAGDRQLFEDENCVITLKAEAGL
ncbi:DUF6520 family protein [uncultured Pedobacter sp.]|uniref:DUF6520 family protein n=1 Tax=uncultured Pedobacter sp. TaxID=246139 RepID=UPI0026342141|nr:DUF6520 family protein [uncultured Pedobacter sp.]